MKDKLIKKKRHRVDWLLMIQVMGLGTQYKLYLDKKKRKPTQKNALGFCRVIFGREWCMNLSRSTRTPEDYVNDMIRVAQAPLFDDED